MEQDNHNKDFTKISEFPKVVLNIVTKETSSKIISLIMRYFNV